MSKTIPELPIPPRLIELIETEKWINPGDDVMLAKVPFIRNSLVFIGNMTFETIKLLGPNETENGMLSVYRGSTGGERNLPWIDVEQSIIIIGDKERREDVAIVLDYRTGLSTPRVVGSYWCSNNICLWREISKSFDDFAMLIGITSNKTT